jgi:hypothetical protein
MQDVFDKAPATVQLTSLAGDRKIDVPFLPIRNRRFVQLRHVASVKIGLQSGANAKFYRIRAGVIGGAVKGGY